MKRITVLLSEDHQIVREGLLALLKLEKDIEVVGEAEQGRRALELARELHPDVIVMDIAMPLLNGMEATRQILQVLPKTKILILSAHNEDAYVEMVMALGASGYLIKQTAGHILAEAIREVVRGNPFFSPEIAKRRNQRKQRSQELGQNRKTSTNSAPLSSRELEVLQLIAEGKANKESAHELKISIKTVEKHRQSLMDKLNIHDTAGLTRYAIAAGIIECGVVVKIV